MIGKENSSSAVQEAVSNKRTLYRKNSSPGSQPLWHATFRATLVSSQFEQGNEVIEYLRDVAERLEQELGPTYRKMGLALDCRYDDVDDCYVISFRAGETICHPIFLQFDLPGEGAEVATLLDASARRQYYEYTQVSGNGWYRFSPYSSGSEDLSQTEEGVIDDLRTLLTSDLEIVDTDFSKPFYVRSFRLAWDNWLVREFCPLKDLMVERDCVRETESYLFKNAAGREIRIEYPFDRHRDATVYCDDVELGQCRAANVDRSLNALLSATLDPEPNLLGIH